MPTHNSTVAANNTTLITGREGEKMWYDETSTFIAAVSAGGAVVVFVASTFAHRVYATNKDYSPIKK